MSEISIIDFKERYPDFYNTIFKAGQESEQERFAVLREVAGGDYELLAECFAEGRNPEDALRLRAEKSERTRDQLTAELQGRRFDLAETEFNKAEKP